MNNNQTTSKLAYKPVDPRCKVSIRELNRHKVAKKLILNNKRKIASAGLEVMVDENIEPGALVEIDLSFPNVPLIYRSRGIVDWTQASGNGYKTGLLIFGMDKVDPNEPVPEKQTTASATAKTEMLQTPASEPQADEQSTNQPINGHANADPNSNTADASNNTADDNAPSAGPAADESQAPGADAPKVPEITGFEMPDEEDIAELFSGLIDAPIEVTPNTDKPLKSKRFGMIGTYVHEDGKPVLLVAADVALANFLGAALLMMPKDEAENDVKAGKITEEIEESFGEICNIAASLINEAGKNKHVKFEDKIVLPKGEFPPEVATIIDDPLNVAEFKVMVPDYGEGRMVLLDGSNHNQ